jgi:hypothetical protein
MKWPEGADFEGVPGAVGADLVDVFVRKAAELLLRLRRSPDRKGPGPFSPPPFPFERVAEDEEVGDVIRVQVGKYHRLQAVQRHVELEAA